MDVDEIIASLPTVLLAFVYLYARDMEGVMVCSWSFAQRNKETRLPPQSPCLCANGLVLYVVDTFFHRVLQFNTRGTLLGTFGTFGHGAGEFDQPSTLVSHNGIVYVADVGNHRVQLLASGSYLRQWDTTCRIGEKLTVRACRLLVHDSTLYAMDHCSSDRIQIRSIAGTLLRVWAPKEGAYRDFHDLAVDGKALFVTSYFRDSAIRVYNHNGALLHTIDVPGAHPCITVGHGVIYAATDQILSLMRYDERGFQTLQDMRHARDANSYSYANGIALSPEGEVFVSRSFSVTVWR